MDRKNEKRLNHSTARKSFLFWRLAIPVALFCSMGATVNADILGSKKSYRVVIEQPAENILPSETLEQWQESLNAQDVPEDAGSNYAQYRFEQDKTFLQKSLKAEGYYQGRIEGRYEETSQTAHFSLEAGRQYRFGTVQLLLEPGSPAIELPETSSLKAAPGAPALAETVFQDQEHINARIEKHHCLFMHRPSHEAVINHLEQRVDITYRVKAEGNNATFGEITFKEHESIEGIYLHQRAGINSGDCFRRSALNDAKLALQRSGLVARADPVLPEQPLPDGSVPVTFIIQERAHRSIKAGASYSTDIGPGVNLGWEHRNFLGQGEKFTTGLSLATLEQRLETTLEKPFFLRKDQRLELSNVLRLEDNDAFRTTGITLSGSVERDLDNKWIAGGGASYGFEQIKDQDNKENVALLSFPLFLAQDKRDDLLNPTRGWTVSVKTAPAFDTIDTTTAFIKNSASGSYYYSLDMASQPVIAVRAATGTIIGASSDTIPATERFYAGGGGSIRGYGYQLAGPLDAQNDPLGGRSFMELSTELRLRITEEYGVVAFIDGGNAFDAAYPDLEGGLLWGAGLGFRYYTSFGPIRADIAVPLDKRSGVDDAFHLYFSIGQAF